MPRARVSSVLNGMMCLKFYVDGMCRKVLTTPEKGDGFMEKKLEAQRSARWCCGYKLGCGEALSRGTSERASRDTTRGSRHASRVMSNLISDPTHQEYVQSSHSTSEALFCESV